MGNNFSQVTVQDFAWERFSDMLIKHEVSSRKGGKFFVGGYFNGPERKEQNMVARTLLTIDCDDIDMQIHEVEALLRAKIQYAFAAYSTYNHKPESPKIRIVIPVDGEMSPDNYRLVAKQFCLHLNLPVDPCSYKPNQLMYMPSAPSLENAWAINVPGKWFTPPEAIDIDLPELLSSDEDQFLEDLVDSTDLEQLLHNQPLDLADTAIDAYLDAYPAADKDYDLWLTVGAALHHQYQGKSEGYAKWVAWSAKSDKHDERQMAMKWRSFGNSARVTTFASIIYHVNEAGGVTAANGDEPSILDELLQTASDVSSLSEYEALKERVTAMPNSLLTKDHRDLVAKQLHDSYAKQAGIAKTSVKQALQAPKATQIDEQAAPAWLEGWVYVTALCEFYNTTNGDRLRREAFNVRFNREADCLLAERPAADMAASVYGIKCVSDLMYWPGAAQIFTHEGREMLNAYRDDGCKPCTSLDAEGQKTIDLFLAHCEMLFPNKDEQQLLLDWMTFVIQNPGKRINWALLIQGAQGTGKTFLSYVLQMILGSSARTLDPTSISGRFTGWAHGSRVLTVEEIRISGTSKYEILDRLKPMLTNDVIPIEEKGRDHRSVPNFTNYLMLTNHKDAIPLVSDDRRYAILFTDVQSQDDLYGKLGGEKATGDYFDALFDAARGRPDALAHYFHNRQLSDKFNARGRAPHTNAKRYMADLSISPERDMIENAITKHECAVINTDVIDVTYLNALCQAMDDELPRSRALTTILTEMGYQQIDKRRVKISKTGSYHYLWRGARMSDGQVRVLAREFHDDPNYVPF